MTLNEKIDQLYSQGLNAEQIMQLLTAHSIAVQSPGDNPEIEDFNDYDVPVKPEVEIDGTSTPEKIAEATEPEAQRVPKTKEEREALKAARKMENAKAYNFSKDPKFNADELYKRIASLSVGEYNILKKMVAAKVPDAKGLGDEALFDAIKDDAELDELIDAAIYRANPRVDPKEINSRLSKVTKTNTKATMQPFKRKSTGEIGFKPKFGKGQEREANKAINEKQVAELGRHFGATKEDIKPRWDTEPVLEPGEGGGDIGDLMALASDESGLKFKDRVNQNVLEQLLDRVRAYQVPNRAVTARPAILAGVARRF